MGKWEPPSSICNPACETRGSVLRGFRGAGSVARVPWRGFRGAVPWRGSVARFRERVCDACCAFRMLSSAISALFLAYYRLWRDPVLYFMPPDVLMDLRNSALAATQRHSGIQCKLVSLFVRCITLPPVTLSKSDHGFSCTFLLMGVFVVTHTIHRASLCSIDHGQEGNLSYYH